MTGKPLGDKLSVVAVLQSGSEFEAVLALSRRLAPFASDIDYVLVANGLDEKSSQLLIRRINELPDATVHFLPEALDQNMGRLVGIDNATGDWLFCVKDFDTSPDMLAEMFGAIEPGVEHITVLRQITAPRASLPYRMLSSGYIGAYRRLTGLELDRAGSGNRLYSRAAALYILHARQAEMLLHSVNLGNFFPGKVLYDTRPQPQKEAHATWAQLMRGWRILLHSTTFPLRLVTVAAILSCVFSALYAVAALIIHALKSNVTPGWTTLSLQISLMFFVVTLLLALISEYLVQIDRGVNHRLRYTISREVRSRHSRLEGQRNLWQVTPAPDDTQEPLGKALGS